MALQMRVWEAALESLSIQLRGHSDVTHVAKQFLVSPPTEQNLRTAA